MNYLTLESGPYLGQEILVLYNDPEHVRMQSKNGKINCIYTVLFNRTTFVTAEGRNYGASPWYQIVCENNAMIDMQKGKSFTYYKWFDRLVKK